MNHFLTVAELAEKLNVSTATIYGLVRRREIPYVRVASRGTIRFKPEDIEQWIKDHTIEPE